MFPLPIQPLMRRRRPGRSWLVGRLLTALFLALVPRAHTDNNPPPSETNRMEMEDFYISHTNGLGSWIWQAKTLDNQTCRFWNTIEIPATGKIAKAQIVMTADNEFNLYLDGRKLGRGAEWRELFVFDVAQLLPPGRHVVAIDCYNGSYFAGMLFGLQVELTDGKTIELKSDSGWRIVPDGVRRWERRTETSPDWLAATKIAPLGGDPWWTHPQAVIMMPPLQPIKIFFWQTGWFQGLLFSACGLVVLISFSLMTQLALHRKERFLLQAERARIAREIHDDIGSRMTQLVVLGEVTQNELPADSELRPQFTWICEEARGVLSTMDEILWAVNPQNDTLLDFADYVCNYAQEFLRPTRIQCRFEVDPAMPATVFNLPLRRSLLMAIKEALNNAVKHSGATELHLQIQRQSSCVAVVVQDNGKGFDPNAVKPGRHGLMNMAQRLGELGGSCQITSQPGQGCRVEFGIPLKRPWWSRLGKARSFLEAGRRTGTRPPASDTCTKP